jgi:hypothetical protein
MDDIRDVLFGLLLEQYLGHELLFAGAKKLSFDERVSLIERREVHLELRRGRRSIDDQLAFFLGAGNELLLSLGETVGAYTQAKT